MPHGAPDDSNVVKMGVVHRLDDLAEAVARLGSPNVWDRRGDMVYQTDFREGMGMFHSGYSGTDGGIALVTGHSRHGAYSIGLRAPDEDDKYAYLQLAFPFQDPSKVGLEFSFSLEDDTLYVWALIAWRDGTNQYNARVRYDHVNHELHYFADVIGWTPWQTGVQLHDCIRPEHTCKLVADMDAKEYVRFMLDAETYSMAGIPAQKSPLTLPPYWFFFIYHHGVADQNPYSYIDCVIVTQNEP